MADRCKHDGCKCEPSLARVDGFCSDLCKDHGAQAEHARHECACGHAPCSADERVTAEH